MPAFSAKNGEGRVTEDCSSLIKKFDEIDVDAFEINISCSHSGAVHGNLNTNVEHLEELLTKIRPLTEKPIWVKLSYSSYLLDMAKIAEELGADAIVCSNSIELGLFIDAETGLPKLGIEGGAGGVTGKAIFPIALNCVYQLAQTAKIVSAVDYATRHVHLMLSNSHPASIMISVLNATLVSESVRPRHSPHITKGVSNHEAKSRKKDWYTITILCSKCQTSLYKYKKEGGGELIKCYVDNILEDYTNSDLCCPNCGQQFTREAIVHNRPAHKIIGGKVIVRGHHGKSK